VKPRQRQLWYHGGPRIQNWEHVRWDRDRSTSDLNAEGPGVYWTTDQEEAWGYTRGEDATVYVATMRDGFKLLPKKRPTMRELRDLYELAGYEDQEIFLSNWGLEMSASRAEIDDALKRYSHQTSLFDASVTLYHDLFRYDSDTYVAAMRSLGYDGFIVDRGTTGGSRRRKHLILWNPRMLDIEEAV